jgi:hypothetical protein
VGCIFNSDGLITTREIFCIHILTLCLYKDGKFEKVGCLFNFNLFRKI